MGNKCDIPPEDNINTHQQAYFPSPQISSSDNFKCSLSITCIGRTLRSPGWGHGYVLTPHNWAATGCRFDVLRFSKDLKRPKPSRVFVQWEDNHGVDLTGQTGPTANKAVRVFQVTSVKAWTGRPIGWTRGIQITSGSNMFKRFRQFQQFMIQHSSDNTSWLSITKHHLAASPRFIVLCHGSPCRINLSFCSLRSGETCQDETPAWRSWRNRNVCLQSAHVVYIGAALWAIDQLIRLRLNELDEGLPSISCTRLYHLYPVTLPTPRKTTLWSLWTAWQLSHCTE